MAVQSVAEDGTSEAAPAAAKAKAGGSKRLLLIIAAVVLLAVIGGAAAYFMGLFGGGEAPTDAEHAAGTEEHKGAAPGYFYDLPEQLVNLNSTGKKQGYLKIHVALELEDADAAHEIEAVLPRIIDSFQVYLRELTVEDLRGSAGLYRLREELLMRVNTAVQPAKVRDVLFKEMLVQ